MTPDISDAQVLRDDTAGAAPAQRASARFMLRHPSRWIALGFGSGLSPWAPGTVRSTTVPSATYDPSYPCP